MTLIFVHHQEASVLLIFEKQELKGRASKGQWKKQQSGSNRLTQNLKPTRAKVQSYGQWFCWFLSTKNITLFKNIFYITSKLYTHNLT